MSSTSETNANCVINISLVNKNAVIPKRANPTDAGADLSSVVEVVIPPHQKECIDTGIAIHFPPDCYARVAPRSGLAFKHNIDVLAGVIDYGYNDTIKVILINHSDTEFKVNIGDRIAQLIFEKIYIPNVIQIIPYKDLLDDKQNSRGLNGFGSTGVQ